MMHMPDSELATLSPLERFVRDYLDVTGGVWDEVEPQVYDMILPGGAAVEQVQRVAFDPEALPEHPGSQLASFGTPLVDRLLASAAERGRYAQAYLGGLNLQPHALASRVGRALALGDGLKLTIERVRPLYFPQAIYWFQAAFVSDQKEQEMLSVAMDLHYAREVRHLEELLRYDRLTEVPVLELADARQQSLSAAYPLARQQVLRTVAALANVRRRELADRVERQIERMNKYYADLQAELEEHAQRHRGPEEDPARLAGRREALEREQRLRVGEVRQKSALRVQLRLANLLVIRQEKLLLRCTLSSQGEGSGHALELVWDPLMEALEAPRCPQCSRPTFSLQPCRHRDVACPECARRPRSPR